MDVSKFLSSTADGHLNCFQFEVVINNPTMSLCVDVSFLFPGGSDGKASVCNAGDLGSIPGSGRSPGEGNGNPLQHSCLENPMDGGA